jgi:hypothetical protein
MLIAGLVVAALSACSTPVGTQGGPGLQFDAYQQKWLFNGEPFTPGGLTLTSVLVGSLRGQPGAVAWFRGTFDKSGGNRAIELRVKYEGAGAAQLFPQSASDATGATLSVKQVEQTFMKTSVGQSFIAPEEIIAIDVPRPFLEARRSTGLDIQVRGASGKVAVVKATGEQVAKYLADFDTAIVKSRQ